MLPGESDLQAVLDRAAEGDVIVLRTGEHRAQVRIARKLMLEGEPGAVVLGPGKGNVITVSAPDAAVRGLVVRGSGRDLERMDSGVFIEKTAARAVVEGNKIEGNLYGVYIHGAPEAVVRGNEITGLRDGRVNEAGNGVSVWDAPGAKVLDNDIRFGRDGIFSIASRKNVFSGNRFRDLRFAVHYMYTNDGEVTDNLSIGNTVGFAVMYSHRLIVRGNVSDGDRDRGFLFNFANGSQISRKHGNRAGAARRALGGLKHARRRGARAWAAGRGRNRGERRPERAHRSGKVRVHLQHEPEPVPEQLVRGLRDRRALHRRLGRQRDRRQRLRQEPQPGEVRRHAPPRLVAERARQLLERSTRPST